MQREWHLSDVLRLSIKYRYIFSSHDLSAWFVTPWPVGLKLWGLYETMNKNVTAGSKARHQVRKLVCFWKPLQDFDLCDHKRKMQLWILSFILFRFLLEEFGPLWCCGRIGYLCPIPPLIHSSPLFVSLPTPKPSPPVTPSNSWCWQLSGATRSFPRNVFNGAALIPTDDSEEVTAAME